MTAPARVPYASGQRHASTVSTTTADAKNGYSATRAALRECSAESLASEYMNMMRASFGMFGHNAATMGNLCAEELIARGITEIPNIFGPIKISTKLQGPASQGSRSMTGSY